MNAGVIGVVLFVVGVPAGLWGLGRKRTHDRIVETPTTAVEDLDEPGRVKLKGRVMPTGRAVRQGDEGGTFVSPLMGTRDAVLSAWEVEEWTETGNSHSWKTDTTGVWSLPFVLDDGTGQVVVDVGDHVHGDGVFSDPLGLKPSASYGVSTGDVLCEFDQFPVAVAVDIDEPTPPEVRRFVEREPAVDEARNVNLVDLGSNSDGDRRYYERSLTVGDEVTVIGQAYPRDGRTPTGPSDLVVSEPDDGDGLLFVTTEPEERLARRTASYQGGLVLGAVGTLGGIVGLVATAIGV